MNLNKISPIIFLVIMTSCAVFPSQKEEWHTVDNADVIVCNFDNNSSPILFISQLHELTYPTHLAPESIISISAEPQTENTFIIHKRLRRYVQSIGDYYTISSLNILVDFKNKNGRLKITPIKKNEHQVSLIGSWPIPKMDMIELEKYLGKSCHIAH